jgi:hypothetical protein
MQKRKMMNTKHASLAGALALTVLFAGCAGNTNALPTGAGEALMSPASALGGVTPMSHKGACAAVTNEWKFNNNTIAAGDYLWFTSVVSAPGLQGPIKIQMKKARITFSVASTKYTIKVPNAHFVLTDSQSANLQYKATGGS